MDNKIKGIIKKQWIMIWIITSVLALSATLVSATYGEGFNSMKRVVVATTSNGKLFSSDWLYENGILNNSHRTKYFSSLSEDQIQQGFTYDLPIHIYNYNMKNPKKHYMEDIYYDISFALTDSTGNEIAPADITSVVGSKTVSIPYIDDHDQNQVLVLSAGNLSGTISPQTLIAEESENVTTTNTYVMSFSNWNLANDVGLCVKIEAVPIGKESGAYKDLPDLGGIIGLAKTSGSESIVWTGEIIEQKLGGSPSSYDAYNVVFTGSGRATITFEWDTTKLAVNKYFYNSELGYISYGEREVVYTPPGEDGWAQIVINADTNDSETNHNRNRYAFQLYKISADEMNDFDCVYITTNASASHDGKWAVCTIRSETTDNSSGD